MNPSIASDNLATRSQRNTISESLSDAKADLSDTAGKVGSKVREFVNTSSDEIGNATKVVNSHIHEKPIQSALIALGVGYIIGSLFRR